MKNKLLRVSAKTLITGLSATWKPYSHLILYGDDVGWVLDWEMRELKKICAKLNIPTVKPIWRHARTPQSIFFSNQFFLNEDNWEDLLPNRIGFAYFHGLPNTGFEGFDHIYRAVQKHHQKISRIQVTHTEMLNSLLQTGIDPTKVFQIPIGINLDFFPYRDTGMARTTRQKLGIPQSAFVIGSIQKDGQGWGDGMEPKLEKGPDYFVETAQVLIQSIPELFFLIVGPSRGYVKAGLEKAGIPYLNLPQQPYPEVWKLYSSLNVYLITARQEGGPKAVLESMASGVPLVTSRVGHAMDIVKTGENGYMADVGDVEALAGHILNIYHSADETLMPLLKTARSVAESHSYEAQVPLWAEFMKGFVE